MNLREGTQSAPFTVVRAITAVASFVCLGYALRLSGGIAQPWIAAGEGVGGVLKPI